MVTTRIKAENNIREFLKTHGNEGFLKLLLTNYLYELVMYYLHSAKNPAAQVREDTSYRFYVDGQERVYPPEKIEQFKHGLHAECKKKAEFIVGTLRKMELIERLTENVMADPQVAQLVHEAFESITERT
jgi:hypothetical protein